MGLGELIASLLEITAKVKNERQSLIWHQVNLKMLSAYATTRFC
jgi:hypothetical protein